MSLFHEQKSFLETNAWQKSNLNSLRYNTSQVGSVIPIIYGTTRQSINLIALGDYRGPQGKKGKSGPLPLGGTHTSAKGKGGGGGKKSVGGKKDTHYSVDVDFGLCQGPVDISSGNLVWSSPGIATFGGVGLNLYTGDDGQAVDPVFDGLGKHSHYSGTCHVTGTPMDLGKSPVIPNISFEITGFKTGTSLCSAPDANPASVAEDFLINARYGAGWPSANLDPDIAVPHSNNYYDYCEATQLAVSPALQSQTDAATWVSELARLTNIAIVWSGYLLKFIPYGDLAINSNGIYWSPNLTPAAEIDDDDLLPWSPHIDSTDPQLGEDDPVIVTRSNPADATNWMSIEYLDRANSYNKTVVPQFDQGSIDRYGLQTEAAVNGNCFCNKVSAENSLKLLLQRSVYIRNTYKFQVGWRHALLEPMDIVLISDSGCGIARQAVRITAIEENENGDLIIDAEEIATEPYPAEDPNLICEVPGPPSITGTNCSPGDVEWRLSAPTFIGVFANSPDRLDNAESYYSPDPDDASAVDNWSVYDTSGTEVSTVSYSDLWAKIFAFAGVNHDPVYGDGSGVYEYHNYYSLWPIHDGEYILAFIARVIPGSIAFWWAVLEPGSLDVLGAYYYTGVTAWPYSNGYHVLGAVAPDQPILVQAYAFLASTHAVLGALPSIDEFINGTFAVGFGGDPFRLQNTMIYPVGGATSADTDFSDCLMINVSGHNQSHNFGFLLPAADGTPNLYIYANRQVMDSSASGTFLRSPEFHNVIQPANPNGCMLKIALGDIDFATLAGLTLSGPYRGAPSGAYSVDNANWLDASGATAIPFSDEYTYISDDTAGGDDVYSVQTGIINRGGGKYWVVFYMVGRADAAYRNAASSPVSPYYTHPIYERVRVFEYTKSAETAREIAKQTCVLHSAIDLPADSNTATWEPSNDNFQIFSVTESGRTATLYIHGHKFKRPFMTFSIPLGP